MLTNYLYSISHLDTHHHITYIYVLFFKIMIMANEEINHQETYDIYYAAR